MTGTTRRWRDVSPFCRGSMVAFATVVVLGLLIHLAKERVYRWGLDGENFNGWVAFAVFIIAVIAGGLEAFRKPKQ